MSGTTANLALPYPTSGDNIAPLETHFKDLADGVEAALGDYPVIKRIGKNTNTSDSGNFTSSDVVTDSITVNLISGKEYEIVHTGLWLSTVASDIINVVIRDTSIAGANIAVIDLPPMGSGVGNYLGGYIRGWYTAAATAAHTFVVVGNRVVGTGTCTRKGAATWPSVITVDQVS